MVGRCQFDPNASTLAFELQTQCLHFDDGKGGVGRGGTFAPFEDETLILGCLDLLPFAPAVVTPPPAAASCSRKFCHSSARVSRPLGLVIPSAPALLLKNSPPCDPCPSDGVEGVLCIELAPGAVSPPRPLRDPKLDVVPGGPPPAFPGRERPACSRCSSVQPRRAAMS